jgi:hypothetical protein
MAHNVESPMRHAHSLPVLRIASPSSVLFQTILASCFVLFAWRVLRPAFGSLSVVFSPLNAFPAKYVSYTFTTPSLNFEVRTSSVSVE